MGGFGGCPMTGYELLGNLDTLRLIDWCEQNQISHNIVEKALHEARHFSTEVFKHQ
jgi:hydroxymethylglutaryl-CoA lyase